MKHLCTVLIVSLLSAINGHIFTQGKAKVAKLFNDNDAEGSGPPMVLVVARDPTTNQTVPLNQDLSCNDNGPIVCKDGFVQLDSRKCYFFSTRRENWHIALRSCQAMGTTLAYPLTAHENTVLVNYLKKIYEEVESWWLGASDHVKEGHFLWAHSKSPIGYADWAVNQPDNAGNSEDCLHIYKPFGWKWNDVPCNVPYNYVCQQ